MCPHPHGPPGAFEEHVELLVMGGGVHHRTRLEALHVQPAGRSITPFPLDRGEQGLGPAAVEHSVRAQPLEDLGERQRPALVLGPDVDPAAVGRELVQEGHALAATSAVAQRPVRALRGDCPDHRQQRCDPDPASDEQVPVCPGKREVVARLPHRHQGSGPDVLMQVARTAAARLRPQHGDPPVRAVGWISTQRVLPYHPRSDKKINMCSGRPRRQVRASRVGEDERHHVGALGRRLDHPQP